ncbi:N-acetylmuramoyl-L-alanine amidase [Streptomyces arenae]|uniref:N-acetylmuramoyl-L-alanine amidase n=1 Tax=Streptomyces arenae TaxID=29301 RepID=UPI00265A3A8A|nr:peptidoglycan recognition family protein [Streptomyces arenae]MCG7209755.1 N-acetylmuramoyl-L-alanine amidase [Streptomyces arenae]
MRGSVTEPVPARHGRRTRRTAGAVASAALLLPLLGAAPPPSTTASSAEALQRAFASAATDYHVPQSVLLAVSYLQSRWDDHGGAPSVSGGYGPMHLTDARTALATATEHFADGTEDPRGDSARPALHPGVKVPADSALPARLKTLTKAAGLTGIPAGRLRTDPAANVAGGAALLAAAQKGLGRPLSADPADWYGAVALFSGADDTATASAYADDVFDVLHTGEERTTDAGQLVVLAAQPDLKAARQPAPAGLRTAAADDTECPTTVSCEWIPAPYAQFGDNDYGNHDLGDRPTSQSIKYIVIHDTEGSWDETIKLVQDPTYVSWNYTIRSTDGLIAQHVKAKDVAWHAGNWYINAKSIGIEHEGFLASPDAWYTEAMYRSSARLVKYLTDKYGIPLDRQHIIGHENVPGPVTSSIPGMHTDPGPFWDWRHYFELLEHPFKRTAGKKGGLVTILPDYPTNQPAYTGCVSKGQPCAAHGSGEVRLYSDHDESSALIKDVGLGTTPTTDVNDLSSRVSTGQQYAVADTWGDWTAIWYLGQKAWFRNPAKDPTAVTAAGLVVTPKAGLKSVPVYGRAYPEASAYPSGVPAQSISPLPYTIPAGQEYVVGDAVPGEYFYATTFATDAHRVVTGKDLYYEIQYGHRIEFVRAADVDVVPSPKTGRHHRR